MPSSSAVDIAKSLRVSEAFNYFQDIAGLHADNLGAGIDHIKEAYDVAWIIIPALTPNKQENPLGRL
jgi:hypothetical protein